MNENQTIETTQIEKNMANSQTGRTQALIDILYLTNVTWLYVFSLIYPLFGIIFGVIISTGSVSDRGKRIGRICLILGIINIVISILGLVLLLVFSRFLNDFTGWNL